MAQGRTWRHGAPLKASLILHIICKRGNPCMNVAISSASVEKVSLLLHLAQSPKDYLREVLLFCSALLAPPKGMSLQGLFLLSPLRGLNKVLHCTDE